MGRHYIQQNPYDKRLNIKLEGIFNDNEWRELMASYRKQVQMILTEDYQIEVDCTSFPLTDTSQWRRLEEIYRLIEKESFRNISVIMRESVERLDFSFQNSLINVDPAKLHLRYV